MLLELRSLLEGICPSMHFFTYFERGDCERLWAQLENPASEVPWSTAVILYDGQCDRTSTDFHAEKWLTPWDWAVALSVSLNEKRSRIPSAGFRCLIVDLLPSNWGSEGRSRFKTVGALTPWIRWYRPLSSPKSLAADFGALFDDLKHSSRLPRMERESLPGLDLHMLSRTWAALFGAPAHRHDIGNLIGPLVLAKGLLGTRGLSITVGEDWVTQRFFSLVKAIGVDVGQDGNGSWAIKDASDLDSQDDREPPPPLSVTKPGFKRPIARSLQRLSRLRGDAAPADRSLRIALVDDQYELGYHKILAHLFFDSGYSEQAVGDWLEARAATNWGGICVRSTSQPEVLCSLLSEALENQQQPDQPRVFGVGEIDILLLDLRLFGGSTLGGGSKGDPSINCERAFLKQLLDLCNRFGFIDNNEPQLARAIRAAERRVNDGQEELLSLTLLPLIIHAVDPSLPIVLFSSTHQRDVVDAFGNHPSIITTFAKPVMSGYASVRLDLQSASDLDMALRRALRLHRMRVVWTHIHTLSQTVTSIAQTSQQGVLVKELRLTPRGETTGTYRIDSTFTQILSSEYRALFLTGRFSDALQVPDNLMEFVGAKFQSPYQLDDLEPLLRLHRLLPSNRSWITAINRALARHELQEITVAALVRCISYLAGNPDIHQRKSVGSLNKLAQMAPSLCADGKVNFTEFKDAEGDATRIIKSVYGSLGAAIDQAMDLRLGAANQKLSGLVAGMDVLAKYQFHAMLAAMRNGRSHFRCRPLEHDRGLELSATWVWSFFLIGLRLLTRGESPISPGPNVDIDLIKEAVLGQWLPSSSLESRPEEGDDYCRIIILRFGNLLRVGLLQCHPELRNEAEHALRIARRDVAP